MKITTYHVFVVVLNSFLCVSIFDLLFYRNEERGKMVSSASMQKPCHQGENAEGLVLLYVKEQMLPCSLSPVVVIERTVLCQCLRAQSFPMVGILCENLLRAVLGRLRWINLVSRCQSRCHCALSRELLNLFQLFQEGETAPGPQVKLETLLS